MDRCQAETDSRFRRALLLGGLGRVVGQLVPKLGKADHTKWVGLSNTICVTQSEKESASNKGTAEQK